MGAQPYCPKDKADVWLNFLGTFPDYDYGNCNKTIRVNGALEPFGPLYYFTYSVIHHRMWGVLRMWINLCLVGIVYGIRRARVYIVRMKEMAEGVICVTLSMCFMLNVGMFAYLITI